jgi:pimeloyl-ACP methyl ester carboxylesterase
MATEIDILQLPTAEVIQAAQTAAVDAAAGAETARADAVAAAELAAQSSALDEDGKLKVSAIPEYLEEASLSNTIGSAVGDAVEPLSEVIEGKLAESAAVLVRKDTSQAVADRSRSAGLARIAFDDTAQLAEFWAASTGWVNGSALLPGGGRAFGNGGSLGASRAFDLTGVSRARIVSTINVVSGTSSGIVAVGLLAAAAGSAPSAGNLRAVGVDTSTNRPIYWGGVAGEIPEELSATALAAGVWTITIEVGPTMVGYTLANSDRSVEYRRQAARPNLIGGVTVWQTDTRGSAGASVGPVGARKSLATVKPAQDVEQVVTTSSLWAEAWADVAAWVPSTALQVSSGRAYYSGSGAVGASRAVTLGTSETALLTTNLRTVAASGGAGLAIVGMTTAATPGTAPNAATLRGIGVETNSGRLVWWGGVSGQNPEYLTATAGAVGDWSVTVAVGLSSIVFTITSPDGSTSYSRTIARGAFANIAVWNTDPRTLTGTSVGTLAVTKTTGYLNSVKAEPGTPTSLFGVSGGVSGMVRQRIVLPANYDSRRPTPLVIYMHGLGGDVTAPFVGSAKNFETAVVNAGYIFAACDAFSMTHFGMEAAIQEILRVYRNIRDNCNIGPVILMGESMGGLVSLNLLGRRLIPGVSAYVGIYPLTSLEVAYATSAGWASQIRTNYGIAADGSDYATKTAGYSPILRDPTDYLGVPMRFYASPGDTLVSKAANTDAFAARVAGVVPETTVIATTGDHGDGSNFTAAMQADLLAFLARNGGI